MSISKPICLFCKRPLQYISTARDGFASECSNIDCPSKNPQIHCPNCNSSSISFYFLKLYETQNEIICECRQCHTIWESDANLSLRNNSE